MYQVNHHKQLPLWLLGTFQEKHYEKIINFNSVNSRNCFVIALTYQWQRGWEKQKGESPTSFFRLNTISMTNALYCLLIISLSFVIGFWPPSIIYTYYCTYIIHDNNYTKYILGCTSFPARATEAKLDFLILIICHFLVNTGSWGHLLFRTTRQHAR